MNERAKTYRRINRIDDWLGTAVNVQAMVFGNLGDNSGTGVGFTRNPATGEKMFFGEYLMNAQGEDVVSGVRTPLPISELERAMPMVYDQLRTITGKMESIIAICRTSSSPSRMASSICCKPATASALGWPQFA
jgi:pyruvate,orthophosphate dikinase